MHCLTKDHSVSKDITNVLAKGGKVLRNIEVVKKILCPLPFFFAQSKLYLTKYKKLITNTYLIRNLQYQCSIKNLRVYTNYNTPCKEGNDWPNIVRLYTINSSSLMSSNSNNHYLCLSWFTNMRGLMMWYASMQSSHISKTLIDY